VILLKKLRHRRSIVLVLELSLIAMFLAGCAKGGFTSGVFEQNLGEDYWTVKYEKLDGYLQQKVEISGDGEHIFSIDITTDSGALRLTITDAEGKELYTGKIDSTFAFKVGAKEAGTYHLQVDAYNHYGKFGITWE
jgi:hypothetical protein